MIFCHSPAQPTPSHGMLGVARASNGIVWAEKQRAGQPDSELIHGMVRLTGSQTTPTSYKVIRSYYLAFLAKPMIFLLFASAIVQSAGIFDALLPNAYYYALLGLCISLAAGFVLCLINGTPVTALFGLAIIGFYIFQLLVFCFHAHVPPNINAIISYLPIISFVLVGQRVVSLHTTLRILAWLSLAYLILYVGLHDYFLSMTPDQNPALLVGDDVRGVRLRLSLELASFCIFYGSTGRNMHGTSRALMIGFGATALWFSGSRTYTALFGLIYLLTALRMLGIGARSLIFVLFLTVSATFLLGLFVPWNPIELVSNDLSGLARAKEYHYAIDALRQHWIVGVGMWTDFDAFQAYLKTPRYDPLYPSDLGILGPYLVFGLVGLVAYLAATYLCIVPRLGRLASPGLRALRLNCVLCGAYGIISPAIALESQSLFLSILIGALLRVRRRPWLQPRETVYLL